jgi:DNA-binding PucR family transcriptional regulator
MSEGGNVTHLLRAYRVGHERVWRVWSDQVQAQIEPTDVAAVLRVSSTHLFAYIDQACQRIIAEHDTARAGFAAAGSATRSVSRHELVQVLLGPDPVDLPAATMTLNYELAAYHVALVVTPLADSSGARRQLQQLIESVDTPALVAPAGAGTWWGWLGWPDTPSTAELAALVSAGVDQLLIGMGEPGRGREGFRRSHAQAVEAERTGRLAQHPTPGVIRHRDVDIAALLCADPERARRVAAERLGPLAVRDETGKRLRATLRTLLANGHNRGLTAKALNVHIKTVTYRLAQIEELLGRDLSRNTSDLDTALLIDHTLYGP